MLIPLSMKQMLYVKAPSLFTLLSLLLILWVPLQAPSLSHWGQNNSIAQGSSLGVTEQVS